MGAGGAGGMQQANPAACTPAEQAQRVELFLGATGTQDRAAARMALAAARWDVNAAVQMQLDAAAGGAGGQSSNPGSYRWLSLDPRSNKQIQYPPDAERAMEEAFQNGTPSISVQLGTMPFTIDLRQMTQASSVGGLRRCWRDPECEPEYLLAMEREVMDCSPERMAQRFDVIRAVDERVERIMETPGNAAPDALQALLKGCDVECILEVYRDIVRAFSRQELKAKYGYREQQDRKLIHLQVRAPVPEYFANVDMGQSIWCRKRLSIAGLANLIVFGPEIFSELHGQNFSGCPDDYPSRREGPHKMRYFTGNAVDLDTVVLRPSDPTVLRAINEQNKHQRAAQRCDPASAPEHASTDAFGSSVQARQIAVAAAGPLIEQFCKDFALSGQAVERRRLNFDEKAMLQAIPRAHSNRDRGKWPLWQYINEGVNSFHANVPNMPDVYGAIIRAPWHLAAAYCTLLTAFPAGEERDRWFADFFEDAVADSCFNAKWKAIEEFATRLGKLGSIKDRLETLQQKHQAEFSAIYDLTDVSDEERDKREAELLLKLCTEGCLTGRDRVGRVRMITSDDCVGFVADPGAPI